MSCVAVSELEEGEEDVTVNQSSSSRMSWLNDMKRDAQEKVCLVADLTFKYDEW